MILPSAHVRPPSSPRSLHLLIDTAPSRSLQGVSRVPPPPSEARRRSSRPTAGPRRSGTAPWIFGRHFWPATSPLAGTFLNWLGSGIYRSPAHLGSEGEGVHHSLRRGRGCNGDRSTLGPHKNLRFQVIACAAARPPAAKNHSPYSTTRESHGTAAVTELDPECLAHDLSRHRMKRPSSRLPDNLAPVAVNLDQAAALIGIGTSLFTQLVASGQMPEPRPIASRLLWDVDEIVAAFRAIPHRSESNRLGTSSQSNNPWN